MTNGEKIKEIYPRTPTGVRLDVDGSNGTMTFTTNKEWWNSEYKEPTTQELQAESDKFDAAFQDGYNNGYAQAKFDYEQEPTTNNNLPQERYQDLIDYFGDKEVSKTILEDRKEFKAWLERVKWHIKRADELARELEQLKGTTKNDLGVNCIDQAELLKAMDTCDKFGNDPDEGLIPLRTPALQDRYVPYVHYYDMVNCVKGMPSVTPISPKGHWIDINDDGFLYHRIYKCSHCGDTVCDYPENIQKYKYCHNCGARMIETQESEDKE